MRNKAAGAGLDLLGSQRRAALIEMHGTKLPKSFFSELNSGIKITNLTKTNLADSYSDLKRSAGVKGREERTSEV